MSYKMTKDKIPQKEWRRQVQDYVSHDHYSISSTTTCAGHTDQSKQGFQWKTLEKSAQARLDILPTVSEKSARTIQGQTMEIQKEINLKPPWKTT